MTTDKLILAVTDKGRAITVADCKHYIKTKDKINLANFIYHRLYGRYLKPFDFPDPDYIKNYKNGFALMTSCCLLIETYASFTKKKYRNTDKQSAKTFGHFFTTEKRFIDFASGGLKVDGTIADKKDGGTPNDFFENVRCGILHNAETRNGWIITRNNSKSYFNPLTKEINATKFANRLKSVLSDYRVELIRSDFEKDDVWINFINRLADLINNS